MTRNVTTTALLLAALVLLLAGAAWLDRDDARDYDLLTCDMVALGAWPVEYARDHGIECEPAP